MKIVSMRITGLLQEGKLYGLTILLGQTIYSNGKSRLEVSRLDILEHIDTNDMVEPELVHWVGTILETIRNVNDFGAMTSYQVLTLTSKTLCSTHGTKLFSAEVIACFNDKEG